MKRKIALLLLLITVLIGPSVPHVDSLGVKWSEQVGGEYTFDRCITCENSYHNDTSGSVNITISNIDYIRRDIAVTSIDLLLWWANVDLQNVSSAKYTHLVVGNQTSMVINFTIPGGVFVDDWHTFSFTIHYSILSRFKEDITVRTPIDHIFITDKEQLAATAALDKAKLKLAEVNQTKYGSPQAKEIILQAWELYDRGLLFFDEKGWINASQDGNNVLDLLDSLPSAEMNYTRIILDTLEFKIEGVDLDLYKSDEALDFFARAKVMLLGAEAAFKVANYTGAQDLIRTSSLFFSSAIQVEADYLLELKQDAEAAINKAQEAIRNFEAKDPNNEEAIKLLRQAGRELQVARSFLSAGQSLAANTNATNAIKLLLSAEELEGGLDRSAQARISLARTTLRPLWDRELSERAAALVDRATEAFNNAEKAYLDQEFSRAIQLADDSLSLASSALQQGGSTDQPLTQDLSLVWLVGGVAALAAAGIGAFLVIRRIRAGYSLFSK